MTSVAYAGGFSLYTEGSPAAVGNFAAGISAEVGDAATGWYNPAGLPLLHKTQLLVGVVPVDPVIKITGRTTYATEDVPSYVQGFKDLNGGEGAAIPVVHFVRPLGERAAFGFSLISPFGLATDWDENSPVRYAATRSSLMTILFSPEIGGMITDHISAGIGLDLEWLNATLDCVLGSPAGLQLLQTMGALVTPLTLDSVVHNTGNSFAIGFHAGILGQFNDDNTRVGLNYQSGVTHQVQGTSVLTGRLADPEMINPEFDITSPALFTDPVHLPAIVTLSAYQNVNKHLAILGSIVYTDWDELERITLNNIAAYSSDLGTTVFTNSSIRENYRSTWRFALGANVHLRNNLMLRMGGGFDQTPTIDEERDVRLPDGDRWAIAAGLHYQMKPYLAFDLGYSYLWTFNPAPINKTIPIGTYSSFNVNAQGKSYANLVGLQATWNFGEVNA